MSDIKPKDLIEDNSRYGLIEKVNEYDMSFDGLAFPNLTKVKINEIIDKINEITIYLTDMEEK